MFFFLLKKTAGPVAWNQQLQTKKKTTIFLYFDPSGTAFFAVHNDHQRTSGNEHRIKNKHQGFIVAIQQQWATAGAAPPDPPAGLAQLAATTAVSWAAIGMPLLLRSLDQSRRS